LRLYITSVFSTLHTSLTPPSPRTSVPPQIADLSLILKDNAPSKTVDPDAEFSGDMWDSEEAKAAEEEDPFWK
jgi:hypothetical protein